MNKRQRKKQAKKDKQEFVNSLGYGAKACFLEFDGLFENFNPEKAEWTVKFS
tara:strand:+ start:218 stop:373 length:156 start_codon:yes stop_codon:yes gene_type:complete